MKLAALFAIVIAFAANAARAATDLLSVDLAGLHMGQPCASAIAHFQAPKWRSVPGTRGAPRTFATDGGHESVEIGCIQALGGDLVSRIEYRASSTLIPEGEMRAMLRAKFGEPDSSGQSDMGYHTLTWGVPPTPHVIGSSGSIPSTGGEAPWVTYTRETPAPVRHIVRFSAGADWIDAQVNARKAHDIETLRRETKPSF